MFKREAIWISFETKDKVKAAVKVSVGGAVPGCHTDEYYIYRFTRQA